MNFYRERLVKKPRKKFVCAYCQEPIIGEHLYISGKGDGYDFCTFRAHIKCDVESLVMCMDCKISPCDGDRVECFRDREAREHHE